MKRALLGCCLLAACSSATRPDGPRVVTVAATADLHGWIDVRKNLIPAADGTTESVDSGGVALLGGYLANLRAADGRVVLVDAGDMFQGTLASNLSEGEVVIDAYNALGYDAAALGNHEFDFGPVGPLPAPRLPSDDPLGALKMRVAQARFPILAANVVEKQSGARPSFLHATWFMDARGVKVGIVGLTSPGTPGTTNPLNVTTLRFLPLLPAAREAAEGLRKEGAEVVIVTAHAGGACADMSNPLDLSSCKPDEEIFQLARDLPPGLVDVIAGGHTHQRVAHMVNGIAVIQASPQGEGLGLARVTVMPDGSRTSEVEGLVSLCARATAEGSCDVKRAAKKPLAPVVFRGKPVAPDAEVAARIQPALAAVAARKAEPLGASLAGAAARSYKIESTLGNFIADIIREIGKTDLAVINSGGLRADMPAGPVTFGAVFEVLPFDNDMAVLELTGREVRELVRLGTSGAHGALQVSGLRVEADVARDPCPSEDRTGDGRIDDADRDGLVSVKLASSGAELDPERVYTVVTSDFLARGGGGLGSLVKSLPRERVKIQTGTPMRDLVVEWFKNRGDVPLPAPGRLVIKNADARCPTPPG